MPEFSQLSMESFVAEEWKRYLSENGSGGGNTKEFMMALPALAEEAHSEGWLSLDITAGDIAVKRFRELDQKQTDYIDPILDSMADGQWPFIGLDDPSLDYGFKTGTGRGGRKMFRYFAAEDLHDMLARESKNLEAAQLSMERAQRRAAVILPILQQYNKIESANSAYISEGREAAA